MSVEKAQAQAKVTTNNGVLHSWCLTLENAEQVATKANQAAEKLGITTRYEAVPV